MLRKFIQTAVRCSKMTGYPICYHLVDILFAFIIHGCTFREYEVGEFYRLKGFDRRKVVTCRRRLEIIRLFNDPKYVHYFQNKVDFNKTFSDFVDRKWLYTKDTDKDEIKTLLSLNKELIVKPINLLQGEGLHLICQRDDADDEISGLLQGEFLIEELIKQSKSVSFNNRSVNTVRVYSVLDRNNEVHIIKAVLRTGVGDAIIDNYSAGGLTYAINEENGIIESLGQDKQKRLYFVHPGTKQIMLGYQIPNWTNLIEFVKQAALVVPQVRFVGWDVAVKDDGFEMIEANHDPGLELLEFIGKKLHYKEIMSYL